MTASVVDSTSRFGRRQWRRRVRRARPWLIGLAVFIAVVFGAWVVLFSSWLGLRTVDVLGAPEITATQVSDAAHVAPGTPLARVNLDAVEARVEAIPAVASATVHRSWPHTIVVTVTARLPVAAIERDGQWWVMDKTGVLFRKTSGPDPVEPVVAVSGPPSTQTLTEIATVLGALPDSLLSTTRQVSAASPDSITLELKNGDVVMWGSAADSSQKVKVLDALMKHKATRYDVSIPSQPALKP